MVHHKSLQVPEPKMKKDRETERKEEEKGEFNPKGNNNIKRTVKNILTKSD